MCEDSLMAAVHFERRFDALMKYVINSQEHPIGKVKDFIYKVEFEIRGSCHYLVTAYFSGLKIYPRISVETLVMFEFNILIMLLRQTSQTNQMWNYTNWSNDSKLIYIYLLISIALNQKCSPALYIKQYKHFNKTSIHITEDHRSVKSFTEGKHHQ